MHDPANPSPPRDPVETTPTPPASAGGLDGPYPVWDASGLHDISDGPGVRGEPSPDPLLPLEPGEGEDSPAAPSTSPEGDPTEEDPMETTSMEFLSLPELQALGLRASFDHDPFGNPEDPEDVFMHPHLDSVEHALLRGIHRRQILAVVGPAGAGKSTLLRRLYGKAGREKRVRMVSPRILDRKKMDHESLTAAILRDLIGQDTRGMNREARAELLHATLVDHYNAQIYPAVVIDEAHLLTPRTLLALKHLWDSHTMFRQLSIIMVGQVPLQSRLKSDPALRELAGRTRLLEVPPLGDQTAPYLRWRFARVGGDADRVFADDAYKAIALRGQYPLWINNLAVKAIQYALSIGDERITARHVGRA